MPTKLHEASVEVPAQKAGASNGLLSREQILAAQDIRSERVEVPEWGGTVMVRGLTGRSRDALELRFAGPKGTIDKERGADFRAAFASMSLVDVAGERMFTDEDVKALGEKSSVALQRVFDAAIRLSAADPSDIDGLVDDLKADPSGGTGSD